MPNYDDPTIPYDLATVGYDGPVVTVFTPAGDAIVPPIYVVEDDYYPCDPLMNRLMRHYRNQYRGRNIFLMSDGTFVDSQVGGTPPNMILDAHGSFSDPYVRSTYVPPGQGTAQEFDQSMNPYVVRVYYGGVANPISAAEYAALHAAGYM